MEDTAETTQVLYNARCPVCRKEIEHYARLAQAQKLPLLFSDLNDTKALSKWNVSKDEAARRLHVKSGDVLLDGIPAFVALWQQIPQYRWLARIVRLPIIYRLSVWTYDFVLAPALYLGHKRRVRKSCTL